MVLVMVLQDAGVDQVAQINSLVLWMKTVTLILERLPYTHIYSFR